MIPDLEIGLLTFALVFKNQILGDPRMVNVAKTEARKRHNNDDETWDSSGEYARGIEMLAQMMDYQDMSAVMQVFAEKIICNLITADGSTDDGKLVI